MPAPRNDAKAEAMFALYSAGHSLAQVAAAFGVTRQSAYKMFKARGYKLREKLEPLPFVVFNGDRYTLRVGGYYGKTTGGRTYLHRDIWEASHGRIPEGFEVHHKDENKANNVLSNFELLTAADHARLHDTLGSRAGRRSRV